jgi:hypothetical protein
MKNYQHHGFWLLAYYLSVHERVQSTAVIENACLIKDMCKSLTWTYKAGVEQRTHYPSAAADTL